MIALSGVSRRSRGCCVFCGSRKQLQEHHLGGRNHARHFTITLCREHHEAVTLAITRAGVNMRYTSDKMERSRRARQAAYVFLWFLDDIVFTPTCEETA
jgi:hypothetical protein